MEFRGCGRLLTVVGLAQSGQPGLRQVGTPLGQPEFAFDQGDHRQVVDRRHVPDVHQPFRFGEFGKGLGELAAAAFEPGDHAMADQHADVATGAGLAQTSLQAQPCGLGLQAHGQQKTFVQRQSGAYGKEPLRRQALQALQPLADFIQRTQHFTPRLQYSSAVVVRQRLEQRVAHPLRQLQGLAVQIPRTPHIAIGNGQVGQGREAHQSLAITLARQALQRFGAIAYRQFAVTAPARDDPAQGQPLRQHRLLRGGRRRRQEAAQVAGQFLGGVQLAGQPQRPAVEHDQARGADQQAIGQVHFPAQQHADVLFGQQLFFGKVLHQVGRNVQMSCPQRLLDRLIEQALGIEPATGAQVQARGRHHRLRAGPGAQQIGKQMVVTIPVAVLVQRHQEHLVGGQEAEDRGAVMGVAHGVA
ncbi:hypothetical protein D3C76_713240 [compost metagenome]